MAIKMLFNNKIQIIFFWSEFTFKINKLNSFVHCQRKFMNKFLVFSFGQIINKTGSIQFEILCNI
jgi:hypothetical protein